MAPQRVFLFWVRFRYADRSRLGMNGGFRRANVIQTVLDAFHILRQDNVLVGDHLRGHHPDGETYFHQVVDLHVHSVNGVGCGEDDGSRHRHRRGRHVDDLARLAVEAVHVVGDE